MMLDPGTKYLRRRSSSNCLLTRPGSNKNSGFAVACVLLSLLVAVTLSALWYTWRNCAGDAALASAFSRAEQQWGSDNRRDSSPKALASTLVMYVFAGSDPEYVQNLKFFLKHGVQPFDGCDYVIVLQYGDGLTELTDLPPLPPNARYLRHRNSCFDIGTVGWLLDNKIVDVRLYRYFVWLNSSVRGPFMPAYLRSRLHWSTSLTSLITNQVKLVGATISCGGTLGAQQPQPHVQSYLSATDLVGLQVLRRTSSVFSCWDTMHEVVLEGELGASKAILRAGYNLDCLMLRYQGLDWTNPAATACNAGKNPIQPGFYDGISVNPLEVMFIKVKTSMRQAGWPHVEQAVKYEAWLNESAAARDSPQGSDARLARYHAIAGNEWTGQAAGLIAEAAKHGAHCFDHRFYADANRVDLAWILDHSDPVNLAWGHFMQHGFQEGRPFRFTC